MLVLDGMGWHDTSLRAPRPSYAHPCLELENSLRTVLPFSLFDMSFSCRLSLLFRSDHGCAIIRF